MRKARNDLSAITAAHIREAIDEFKELGRQELFRRYGRSRSSRYFLYFEGRFFDTKALVSVAHRKALGRRASNLQFSGGAQTKAVIDRLLVTKKRKDDWRWFEDIHGELANLSGEFDRLPGASGAIEQMGFSNWISFKNYSSANTLMLPGVYVLARARGVPQKVSAVDERIVYVGETTGQALRERLYQLSVSLEGRLAHSGGQTLRDKGVSKRTLYVAVRPFPLDYRLKPRFAESVRSAQIKYLERMLLNEFSLNHGRLPLGNSR
jgi:hypothetical protein